MLTEGGKVRQFFLKKRLGPLNALAGFVQNLFNFAWVHESENGDAFPPKIHQEGGLTNSPILFPNGNQADDAIVS